MEQELARLLRRIAAESPDLAEFLRRLHLDLTGLPPTPDQVRSFLTDEREAKVKRAEQVHVELEPQLLAEFLRRHEQSRRIEDQFRLFKIVQELTVFGSYTAIHPIDVKLLSNSKPADPS